MSFCTYQMFIQIIVRKLLRVEMIEGIPVDRLDTLNDLGVDETSC